MVRPHPAVPNSRRPYTVRDGGDEQACRRAVPRMGAPTEGTAGWCILDGPGRIASVRAKAPAN